MISFFCGNCGQKIETEDAAAGTTIVCASCGQPAAVPARPAAGPSTVPRITVGSPPNRGTRKRLVLGIAALTVLVLLAVLWMARNRSADSSPDDSALEPNAGTSTPASILRGREAEHKKLYRANRSRVDRRTPEEIVYLKHLYHRTAWGALPENMQEDLYTRYWTNDFGATLDQEPMKPLVKIFGYHNRQQPKPTPPDYWIELVAKVAKNPGAPSSVIRAEIANMQLASNFMGAVTAKWNALPCEKLDPEFTSDANLRNAAVEWAHRAVTELQISDVVRSLDDLRIPVRIHKPTGPTRIRSRTEPDTAPYQPDPPLTIGKPCTATVTLDYRFHAFDPNTSVMTLVAELPSSGIIRIPERVTYDVDDIPDLDEFSWTSLSRITITPDFHGVAGIHRDGRRHNASMWSHGDEESDRAEMRSARYPNSANKTDTLALRMDSDSASKMKRGKRGLKVTHTCSVEFEWQLRLGEPNLDFYRPPASGKGPPRPVELQMESSTHLQITTTYEFDGVKMENLPSARITTDEGKTRGATPPSPRNSI